MSDLMAWNADATRMPARMHGQYLRQLFLHNDLAANRYRVDDRPVMLRDLRLPLFCVGTENDHVAPWRSVFKLHGLTPAPLDFVLTSGGHNAGIVSEPGHPRRRYRSLARPAGGPTLTPDEWLQAAPAHDGSWWPAWASWLAGLPASPQAARPGRAAPRLSCAGGRARRLCPGERGMTPDPPARPASARVLRALGAALLPLLAGGCPSMAPDYQRPAAPVPTTYEQAPAADAEAPAAATVGWRDYYTDPILQDLIDRALRNNRDLRTALLRVEEARALYGIQRADQFPTIGVQADGSRARVPGDLNLTRQPQISSQYQVGVGMASWELDFWGRVRSLKDAALQNYLASDAAARAATLSLITQVADGYLTLRELDERLR